MRNEGETAVQLGHQAVTGTPRSRGAASGERANRRPRRPGSQDHKYAEFSSALVQALRAARMRGEDDAGDVLTLT